MTKLSLSQTHEYLLQDGHPFFYQADTVWGAFCGPSLPEWADYLRFRRRQGFNVLQINLLPQWDAAPAADAPPPFVRTAAGPYDFTQINDVYFQRVEKYLEAAVEAGFIPALVLLWCNYVPETWGGRQMPETVMSRAAADAYTAYAVQRLARFRPIYVVSGDTDFPQAALPYYMDALQNARRYAPDCLTAMHIGGERNDLPEAFVQTEALDLYFYQSGHGSRNAVIARRLAEAFREKAVKRPIINSEPCYEGHGCVDGDGRHGAYAVRRAIWSGLLSGAKAGIAYGAHGLWGFHHEGDDGRNMVFSGRPHDWRDALQMPGSWEPGFIRWAAETYRLYEMNPAADTVRGNEDIQLAMTPDAGRAAIYMPYADRIMLRGNWQDYRLTVFDLQTRHLLYTKVVPTKRDEWEIPMLPVAEDALILAEKE